MPLIPKGLTSGFVDRIRERVTEVLGLGGEGDAAPAPDEMQLGPTGNDIPLILYRIRHAARTVTLLWMKYNGEYRHVQPYSFRNRSRGQQPLFFGHCELHDIIHSFRIDRIQDVQITDRPFKPIWDITIG